MIIKGDAEKLLAIDVSAGGPPPFVEDVREKVLESLRTFSSDCKEERMLCKLILVW